MVQSIRCKCCKQLKSAERELADLQVLNRDQSLELSRARKQMNQLYNELKQSKEALAESMRATGKLSNDLSVLGGELHKVKTELGRLRNSDE